MPPGTWSTVQSKPLSGLHSKNLAPLQLRRARQMKIYAARQRDAAELQLLRQKVHDLVKRPQYITVEVEKIVEVPKIVQDVDQMDEHPKVKKSKLSQEDEFKAEEREQLLMKKIAQLQEDLERLDAENHHLLGENKHLNEENLKVKPEMRAMLERMALIMKEEFDKQKQTMMEENMTWKRMMEEFKVLAEKRIAQLQEDLERLDTENNNLLKANKELNENKDMMKEAKADDDKTKMLELQKKMKRQCICQDKEVGNREG